MSNFNDAKAQARKKGRPRKWLMPVQDGDGQEKFVLESNGNYVEVQRQNLPPPPASQVPNPSPAAPYQNNWQQQSFQQPQQQQVPQQPQQRSLFSFLKGSKNPAPASPSENQQPQKKSSLFNLFLPQNKPAAPLPQQPQQQQQQRNFAPPQQPQQQAQNVHDAMFSMPAMQRQHVSMQHFGPQKNNDWHNPSVVSSSNNNNNNNVNNNNNNHNFQFNTPYFRSASEPVLPSNTRLMNSNSQINHHGSPNGSAGASPASANWYQPFIQAPPPLVLDVRKNEKKTNGNTLPSIEQLLDSARMEDEDEEMDDELSEFREMVAKQTIQQVYRHNNALHEQPLPQQQYSPNNNFAPKPQLPPFNQQFQSQPFNY